MDVTHINVIFQVLRGRFWLCLQVKQLSQQQVNVHYLLAIPGVQKTGRARLVSPASSKTTRFSPISLKPLTDSFSHRRPATKHAALRARGPKGAHIHDVNARICKGRKKKKDVGQRLPSKTDLNDRTETRTRSVSVSFAPSAFLWTR